jgi:hypothetical protein
MKDKMNPAILDGFNHRHFTNMAMNSANYKLLTALQDFLLLLSEAKSWGHYSIGQLMQSIEKGK